MGPQVSGLIMTDDVNSCIDWTHVLFLEYIYIYLTWNYQVISSWKAIVVHRAMKKFSDQYIYSIKKIPIL